MRACVCVLEPSGIERREYTFSLRAFARLSFPSFIVDVFDSLWRPRIRLKDVQLAPGLAPLNPNANVIFVTCKKITAELGATKTDEESA